MRVRYWHLTIQEVLNAKYPLDRINHWEIKCLYGEYEHFGIFWFKYGTPFDKEPVHGLCFYYNEIPDKIVNELIEYILSKFGGKILRRQTRVFLEGSQEVFDPDTIGKLANELSGRLRASGRHPILRNGLSPRRARQWCRGEPRRTRRSASRRHRCPSALR